MQPHLVSKAWHTAVTTAVVAAAIAWMPPASAAEPATDYEMPFPCAQEWTGTTRVNHSPNRHAIDWNRPDDDGDAVVAAASGVVTVADTAEGGGYGRWVLIDHGGGESSLYAHLSQVSVRAGQTVDQGALLGAVGATGRASGPHLHFEERLDDQPVRPWFHGTEFVFGSTLGSSNCVSVPLAMNFSGGPPAEAVLYHRGIPSAFEIQRRSLGPKIVELGGPTDEPVLGDWDGNGLANVGVRTPATRAFTLRTPAGISTIVFGGIADKPVAGDWDGDGTWEVGVRRPRTAAYLLRAADGSVTTVPLGDVDDLPVTGDWNGDKVTDLGVFDQATATFTLRVVDEDGLAWTATVPFGSPGDLPVVGDWDGNGKTDLGAWDPSTAMLTQRIAPAPDAAARSTNAFPLGDPR